MTKESSAGATISRRMLLRAAAATPLVALGGSSDAASSGRTRAASTRSTQDEARFEFLDGGRMMPTGEVGQGELFVYPPEPRGDPRLSQGTLLRVHAGQDASGHFRDFGGAFVDFSAAELDALGKPMGRHVLECVRNGADVGFSRLGSADFVGVRLSRLFAAALGDTYGSALVEVRSQQDGWIFTVQQLRAAGAFLALRMNGAPLSRLHGQPLRLVVPGWFGCAQIKWVNEIRVVDAAAPATPHMRSFAAELMLVDEKSSETLARDVRPALLGLRALPTHLSVSHDGSRLDIAGVAWGDGTGARLEIAVVPLSPRGLRTSFEPVSEWTAPTVSPDASELVAWRHQTALPANGEHALRLRVAGPSRQRPLPERHFRHRLNRSR